jgi:GTP pyrophosphokinase
MHQHSEYGVAAHWRYKEGAGTRRDPDFEEKIAWLRQVLDWKERSPMPASGCRAFAAASSPTRSTCSRRRAR